MARNISQEVLARGFSACDNKGVLEVAIHNPGRFLELSLAPSAQRVDAIRIVHDVDNEGWLIAQPVDGLPGKWRAVEVAYSPLEPVNEKMVPEHGPVPGGFALRYDDIGVYVEVGIEQLHLIRLAIITPDADTQPILIGWDSYRGGWSFLQRTNIGVLDEIARGISIIGHHECAYVEPAKVSPPPVSQLPDFGLGVVPRVSSSGVREMLKGSVTHRESVAKFFRDRKGN